MLFDNQGGTPTQPPCQTPPQEYRVILTQPSVCNTQQNIPEQRLCLSVSRDEILNAALHFKGLSARNYLQDGIDKGFPIVELTILNKTLKEYLDAMFSGGRWTDDKSRNPNAPRLVTMIDYNKEESND
jgi:hypothetical protein